MSIKDKIKETIVKIKFATKKPTSEQNAEYCKLSKKVLEINARDLKKYNHKVWSDFSYGPDGPDQQMWETTKLLDDGSIYKKTNLDNYGKKSTSVELIIDGKFISYYGEEINNLTIESKSNKFIETTISELPKELADKIKSTIQLAESSNKKEENSSENSQVEPGE